VTTPPTTRPRLLFLCQTLPYPPDAGVKIRSFNVLRLLADAFDVHALCFYRRAERQDPDAVERGLRGLRAFATAEAFPIPQEYSTLRRVRDHARSVTSGIAYTYHAYRSRGFEGRLCELVRTGDFPIAHVDSLDLASHIPTLDGMRVVCTHHNVESALLARRAAGERSAIRRWYLGHQAGLLERMERYWCPRVSLNIVVSDVDAERLRRIAPAARCAVVPNGVDTEYFRPVQGEGRGVVFVGGSNWFPNRDALEFFCSEVLPLVRRIRGDVEVTWVGQASEHDQALFRTRYGVHLTGRVPDIRPYVASAACYVVPLRVGGGTRLKILDAWAMGKAVVSTPVGCEGLEAIDGHNILVRSDPGAFAVAVCEAFADEGLRRRLGQQGRETVERKYSWEVIRRDLVDQYVTIPARGSGGLA
jgi:glycosyltransferase involved in cell wall biosynthesis